MTPSFLNAVPTIDSIRNLENRSDVTGIDAAAGKHRHVPAASFAVFKSSNDVVLPGRGARHDHGIGATAGNHSSTSTFIPRTATGAECFTSASAKIFTSAPSNLR